MPKRGPRTPQGRAAVTASRVTGGLTPAAPIVLPRGESESEWREFHRQVVEQCEPAGPVEAALASRIAELLWRLRRVARAERQFVIAAEMRRDVLEHHRDLERADRAAAAPPDATALDDAARRARLRGVFGGYTEAILGDQAERLAAAEFPMLLPDDRSLDKIIRYEAHLSRQLNRTMHELEALQNRRRGDPSPLARLDIN